MDKTNNRVKVQALFEYLDGANEMQAIKTLDLIEYLRDYDMGMDLIFTYKNDRNKYWTVKIFGVSSNNLVYKFSSPSIHDILKSALKFIESNLLNGQGLPLIKGQQNKNMKNEEF